MKVTTTNASPTELRETCLAKWSRYLLLVLTHEVAVNLTVWLATVVYTSFSVTYFLSFNKLSNVVVL